MLLFHQFALQLNPWRLEICHLWLSHCQPIAVLTDLVKNLYQIWFWNIVKARSREHLASPIRNLFSTIQTFITPIFKMKRSCTEIELERNDLRKEIWVLNKIEKFVLLLNPIQVDSTHNPSIIWTSKLQL